VGVNGSGTSTGAGERREGSVSGRLPMLPANCVYVSSKNNAVTTSVAVGKLFGKRPGDVLTVIKNLEVSEEFRRLNFYSTSYHDRCNRQQPLVVMSRAGFMRLVMAFTGKKAAVLKEAYIAEFDRMEAMLRSHGPLLPPIPLPSFASRQVQVHCTKQAARRLLHSQAGMNGLVQHHRGVMKVLVGKTPTEYVRTAVAAGMRVGSFSGRELLRRLDPPKAAVAAFLDDQLQRGKTLEQLTSAGVPEALTAAFAAMFRAGITTPELQAA
jgi:Rha family phage regulatory protein